MKKIVFMSVYQKGLNQAFFHCGYEVIEPRGIRKEDRLTWINEILRVKKVDIVFSFDFIMDVAKICWRNQITYISWLIDSPRVPLYSKVAEYETNKIFLFDCDEYKFLKNNGRTNVYYQPLATDVMNLHNVALTNKNVQFNHDISFMGNLYDDDRHSLFDKIKYLPPYVKGYIDGLFNCQINLWGVDLFRTNVLNNIEEELQKYICIELDNQYYEDYYKIFWDTIFGMKVAQIERKEMCNILSSEYDFALYTGSDTSYNLKIKNYGYIDYLREMPVMFHSSKININLNLHCISSGIPLRIIDIMACEGFCLTNYQPELYEYFVEGEDFVVFSDFEEMREKIDYYLQHEDERRKIARNGYEKVKRMFDYSVAIPKMIQIIEDSNQ